MIPGRPVAPSATPSSQTDGHALPAVAAADTIPAMLARRCADTPEAVAFHEETGQGQWRTISWQAFADQVAQLRRALQAAGLRHGDRLALIAQVSLRWECLHHAAMGLGLVVVGLDTHDLPERLAGMVEQADITAIATSSPSALSAVSAQRLASCKLRLHLDDAAHGASADPAWQAWADFVRQADAVKPSATDNGATPVRANDLATIIFTSGTTGAPKGIGYSHEQVCLAVAAICDAFGFVDAKSRLLCWLPLSNLFQRMVNLAAMRQGPATYLLDDPRRVMDVVARVSPDIFIGVPRFFEKLHAGLLDDLAGRPWPARMLVHLAWRLGRRWRACERTQRPPAWWLRPCHALGDRLVLRRVRAVMGDRLQCMVSGSAPMALPLLEDLHALGWLVLESYGMTENILPMSMNRIDGYRLGTVGRTVPGNEIRIDDGGHIHVRGPCVFRGYLGSTGAHDAAIDAQGWYGTGDLGAFDSEGYLRLTGRSGDLFKTSTGRRIAPAGVEGALRGLPGIDQTLLLGAGRKCPVALFTCSPGLSPETVRQHLAAPLRACLESVNSHDRPVAVGLLPQAFSIAQGELTPNLKLRREVIAQRHAALVEALYAAVDAGRSDRPDVLLVN